MSRFLHIASLTAVLVMVCAPLRAQAPDDQFLGKYQLRKMVMVGRHGVRSASLSKGERRITPHPWHQWSVGAGQLTERGALLEQYMGCYFRAWLTKAGLFSDDDDRHAADCYVYANTMRRTVETASSFLQGFMPQAGVEVVYNKDIAFGDMDQVFNNASTYAGSYFLAKVKAEAEYASGPGGFAAVVDSMQHNAAILASVLDLAGSPACQQGDTCSLTFPEPYNYLHKDWMPRIRGGRIDLTRLTAGNFILQHYDAPSPDEGTFGLGISDDDLIRIGYIKEMWCFLSMGTPSVGKDAAHHLLVKLEDVLQDDAHHFVYLVGHDSNLSSLTGALGVKPYMLPDTPEMKTPLGGKLVLEIWEDEQGEAWVGVRYVYQSLRQVMELMPLSLDCPPASYPLELTGLQPNDDGLYRWQDVLSLIRRAIDDYGTLNVPLSHDVNLDGVVDMLDAVDIVKYSLDQPFKVFYQPQADTNTDGVVDTGDAIQLARIIAGGIPGSR